MKHSVLVSTVLLALSMPPVFAAEVEHHHPHDEHPAELQLNAGKKWETDAPLRQSMTELRQLFASNLEGIHANEIALGGYHELARNTESAVSRIVAQCKLPPAADAQLHIIVAELLSGAEMMSDHANAGTAHKGAVKVIESLNRYGQYFNDPGFKMLSY